MSSRPLGNTSSAIEVTNISSHGVWILAADEEFFLSYENFPWFKDARVGQVLQIEQPTPGHFYWPDLDIDIGIETIKDPDRFPLKAK